MACEMLHFSSVIPLSVAPVVVISACGLLCLTFYNRLAFLVAKLRGFQKESIEHTCKKKSSLVQKKLFGYLQEQIRLIHKRAQLIRSCLFFLILSIFCEAATCLCIALSLVLAHFEAFVLMLFLVGLVSLLLGLIFAARELLLALHPVKLEKKFINTLLKEQSEQAEV